MKMSSDRYNPFIVSEEARKFKRFQLLTLLYIEQPRVNVFSLLIISNIKTQH